MKNIHSVRVPTKIKYKLLTAFYLMSLIPTLVTIYISSQFTPFSIIQLTTNWWLIAVIIFFSFILSICGFLITKQLIRPIIYINKAAENIVSGRFEEAVEIPGIDGVVELERLSENIKKVSDNSRDLVEKVDKLSGKDKVTGLYNEFYIKERLEEEILQSMHWHRACSLSLFYIEGYADYLNKEGPTAAEQLLKSAAGSILAHISKVDKAARINKGEFGIVFVEKNKKETIEIMEKIQKDVHEQIFMKKNEKEKYHLKMFIGISSNPIDGASAEELFAKANERMMLVMQKSANVIEAF